MPMVTKKRKVNLRICDLYSEVLLCTRRLFMYCAIQILTLKRPGCTVPLTP